jgi:sugar lactone lactonase YvrE
MKTEQFVVVHDEPMKTGECPVWHAVESALYWVDVPAFTVHRLHPASGKYSCWKMPTEPSAIAVDVDNNLVVATRAGFVYLNTSTGEMEDIAPAPYDPTIMRFNDGRVDPAGRFWVGTLYEPRDQPKAEMHVLDKGKLRQAWSGGMTNSNGLAWTPDGKTMFHADTTSHRIDVYDYDVASGRHSHGRNLVVFEANKTTGTYGGRPDGAAIDSEGNYWIAMYEGGRILKLSPTGELLQQIDLPLKCPTAVCFGGPDLRTLYVTSACGGRPAEELAQYPHSGKVLAFRVDVAGLEMPEYRG